MYFWMYFAATKVINGPGQFEESVTNSASTYMSSVLHWVSICLSLASARATQTVGRNAQAWKPPLPQNMGKPGGQVVINSNILSSTVARERCQKQFKMAITEQPVPRKSFLLHSWAQGLARAMQQGGTEPVKAPIYFRFSSQCYRPSEN